MTTPAPLKLTPPLRAVLYWLRASSSTATELAWLLYDCERYYTVRRMLKRLQAVDYVRALLAGRWQITAEGRKALAKLELP